MPSSRLYLLLALSACAAPEDQPSHVIAISAQLHENIESLVRVSWVQQEPARTWLAWSEDGVTWEATPRRDLDPGVQQALLLGCPYDNEIRYRVITQGEDGRQRSALRTIQTGQLPDGFPQMEVLAADDARWDPSLRWVLASMDEPDERGLSSAFWSFIFDRQGRPVWAWPTPQQLSTAHPRISQDGGSILLDYNSFFSGLDGGAASHVRRMGIDGSLLERWHTPGLHHAYTDLDDGSIAWHSLEQDPELRVAQGDGSWETIWRCDEFYDQLGLKEQCGANSLTWHPAHGHLLLSIYSTDTVVEIDPQRGSTQRWFGHSAGSWDFEPLESAFWWQHGAHYTDAGTLLLSAQGSAIDEETVVREYALDPSTRTLRQIWSFGEGEGLYGSHLGEAHRLPGGNTLHNYGTGARLREVTPEGEVAWDVAFSPGTWLGRSTPIEDLYALLP